MISTQALRVHETIQPETAVETVLVDSCWPGAGSRVGLPAPRVPASAAEQPDNYFFRIFDWHRVNSFHLLLPGCRPVEPDSFFHLLTRKVPQQIHTYARGGC